MEQQLRNQFFTAMMRFKKMESVFSGECEIQMNELAVLQSIAGDCGCDDCGVNLNVPEIQSKLQITKPAVSYILNALEKKNYIIRGIDPRDRRKISITATPEGRLAAEESTKKFNEMWNLLLTRFGDEEMRQLVELLESLTGICGNMCGKDETGC